MNKLKFGLLFFTAMFFSGLMKAQTLEEGKKFMYYERYKSAKAVFEKLVAASPGNVDAVYWLGQSMIASNDNKDIAGAKALYQKTLMENSNSPLLLVGMGHIELLEGKTQDARARFETALSLTQSKNAVVLNAIGFANVDAKNGDAEYAIEKLKLATTLKNMKDPDVYANLGDAYKKITQGGPAQSAYEAALELNPNYARSLYRIGKIYQTQGESQKEIYSRYYDDAIAKDPTYGPVYENLYQMLYLTNIVKSAEYLDKFLANTDDDPKNCFYKAQAKYAQGLFAESITTANGCISSQGASPYLNLYGLIAYAYDRLGDSVNAKKNFELYFSKQSPEKIGPTDWATYGKILLKFPENEIKAGESIDKAVALDSVESSKVGYLKTMTGFYEFQKKYKDAADWYSKIVSIRKDVKKTDLYNAGYNYFRAGDFVASINTFNVYSQKFPDDAFGYYMKGKAGWAIDSTLEQALANPDFEKAIEVGVKDSVKFKNQLIGSYKYFIVYYASSPKKDKATALSFCDKVLWLDPNDAETIGNKTAITSMNFNAPAPKPKQAPAGTKPATGKPADKGNGSKGPDPKRK